MNSRTTELMKRGGEWRSGKDKRTEERREKRRGEQTTGEGEELVDILKRGVTLYGNTRKFSLDCIHVYSTAAKP